MCKSPKPFETTKGQGIAWNPITQLSTPKEEELQALQEILASEEQKELLEQRNAAVVRAKIEDQRKRLFCCKAPRMKECKKALEMDPGEYAVARYAEKTCRNAPKTILFISPIDESGQQITHEMTPIWGAFLQEEIERIGPLDRIEGDLYCRLGREKTTKSKNKCRIAQLFVAEKN